MRSFLIRDILSGPAPAQTSGACEPSRSTSGRDELLAGQPHQAGSSATFAVNQQSLAATQARFLAKLAEHQQQVQASKYYEQLQHQHQQLLNNLNLNHHHLQLQQLRQQQQQHQHQHQHQHQQHRHPNKFEDGPGNAISTCNGPTLAGDSAGFGSAKTSMSATSGSPSIHGAGKKAKASSFAYDCASPISSISDVDQVEEDEDEDDDDDEAKNELAGPVDGEDDDEDTDNQSNGQRQHQRRKRRRNSGQVNHNLNDQHDDDDDEDGDDDEEEEIEVERLSGEEISGGRGNATLIHSRQSSKDHNQQGKLQFGSAANQQQQQLSAAVAPFQLNSPLDALFQMTSSTFDALKRGEKRKDRESEQQGATSFTSKQTSKKKRKSRTAFTNNQIYELERRFRLQKYLSPTDRDEIAITLNLSNAQVITWFQNRRAKLKRDLEEQKRDIETASFLHIQRSFLESIEAHLKIKQ